MKTPQPFTPGGSLLSIQVMDRAACIDAALARCNYAPHLRERIERLLDGHEDRSRLRCCSSGCFVCAQQLLDIVAEVEAASPPFAPP